MTATKNPDKRDKSADRRHLAMPRSVAHSVGPTRTTYMLRRIVVAVALAMLVAVCAIGAGWVWSDSVDSRQSALAEPEAPIVAEASAPSPTVPTPSAAVEPVPNQNPPQVLSPGVDQQTEVDEQVAAPDLFPPRASRFVAQGPQRVLDTRDSEPLSADSLITIEVKADDSNGDDSNGDDSNDSASERTAVALSVSVIATTSQGSVSIDGRAGIVEAVAAPRPGVSTTNLVFVPLLGDELAIRSSTGGHIVIDLVGEFARPDRSDGGRLVTTPPIEVARLVTATDGREATVSFEKAVPADHADAVLVAITADVGSDGGIVRLSSGDASGQMSGQMLMWGPATNDSQTRRGLVILKPGPDGTAVLRYDGGSVLTAEVVGYFTSDLAADDQPERSPAGLYLPSGPRELLNGRVDGDGPIIVGGINPLAESALLTTTASSPGSGIEFPGSQIVPVEQGTVTFRGPAAIESKVTLLGVFLGTD